MVYSTVESSCSLLNDLWIEPFIWVALIKLFLKRWWSCFRMIAMTSVCLLTVIPSWLIYHNIEQYLYADDQYDQFYNHQSVRNVYAKYFHPCWNISQYSVISVCLWSRWPIISLCAMSSPNPQLEKAYKIAQTKIPAKK